MIFHGRYLSVTLITWSSRGCSTVFKDMVLVIQFWSNKATNLCSYEIGEDIVTTLFRSHTILITDTIDCNTDLTIYILM